MFCAACNAKLEFDILDLGKAPITNNLLSKIPKKKFKESYSLKVSICNKCWLTQTKHKINPKKIFNKDYPYFSSFSSSWLSHCEKLSTKIIKKFNLDKNSLVAEVASNDGYLLQYFKKKNIKCYGIEPTKSTANAAKKKGIKTFNKFFNTKIAKHLSKNYKADVIIANNVLAHVPNLRSFINSFRILLKKNGVAIFEFHYLLNLIKKNQFDTFYHEHYFYHSLYSLNKIFNILGLKIFDAEKIKSHGGSLRIYVCKSENIDFAETLRLKKLKKKEIEIGINKKYFYAKLQSNAILIKNRLRKFLSECKKKKDIVMGYGAAAKGITLINFSKIGHDTLEYIIDKNPAKQNKILPQSNIKIVDLSYLKKIRPKYIIILPWNLKNEVKDELNFIKNWGGKFVVFVPKFQILK